MNYYELLLETYVDNRVIYLSVIICFVHLSRLTFVVII